MRRFVVLAALALGSCGERPAPASYVPIDEVERDYGRLIAAANHPTPGQHGTEERIGLFQGRDGTIAADGDRSLRACAPAALRDARITASFPAGSAIIGATNEPTGWRGGTGCCHAANARR